MTHSAPPIPPPLPEAAVRTALFGQLTSLLGESEGVQISGDETWPTHVLRRVDSAFTPVGAITVGAFLIVDGHETDDEVARFTVRVDARRGVVPPAAPPARIRPDGPTTLAVPRSLGGRHLETVDVLVDPLHTCGTSGMSECPECMKNEQFQGRELRVRPILHDPQEDPICDDCTKVIVGYNADRQFCEDHQPTPPCRACGAPSTSHGDDTFGNPAHFCSDHAPTGVCEGCGDFLYGAPCCISEPAWTEGTWGPRKLERGGHSYDRTPVNGDVIKSPAGAEWVVVGALNPNNPTTVTVRSLDGAKTLQETPPNGWSQPVTFRRGERGTAASLLATHLGATEIKAAGGRARRSAGGAA